MSAVQKERKKYKITEDEFREHCNDYDGLCLACGEWTFGGVEPDARGYLCESCEALQVYGAEEVMMMGLLIVEE